ncbi:MAG: right-handed parallel beta-helix repeat-containing protein [Actinomycetota bacterium]
MLFQGRARFADEVLIPRRSGRRRAPITFGSYGVGRARLDKGVWLDESHLVFRRLEVDGGGRTSAGIASSRDEPVADVAIERSIFRNVGIGILSPKASDSGWSISHNRIARTGDSGLILLGSGFTVSDNKILLTGSDPQIEYGKHGIYAKGADMRIVGNRIEQFEDNGISTRYPDAVILNNRLSGGPIGVAYFQDAPSGGTTRIAGNVISGVDDAAIYVVGSTAERFVIASNSIRTSVGIGIHVKTVPDLTVANNLVTGISKFVLAVDPPSSSYSEHHNLWFSAPDPPELSWGGDEQSLAGYRAVSGQGQGDLVADPRLRTGLSPRSTSPAIDAGTVDVSPLLVYRHACKRRPLRFCGASPDIGAVEYLKPRNR